MKMPVVFMLLAFLCAGILLQIKTQEDMGTGLHEIFVSPKESGEGMMINGINIGNALESPNPGEWGVNIKPYYFEKIRKAGFNTVRLPVRFSGHTQTIPPYNIDPKFLKIVDETVEKGLQNGLIIILDVHHYSELMQNPMEEEKRFLGMWRQLSSHYQNFSDNLYFELLNEPSKNMNKDRWNELLKSTIQVIREKNLKRWILIDAGEFSDIEMLPTLELPDDKHLVATFHFYEPFPFTHQGASWVDGSAGWKGTKWLGTEEEKAAITQKLDRAVSWSEEKHVPLVMGEFGVINHADRESRLRWTAFMAREAEKRNIGWIHWQFCSDFPIFSCKTDQWDEGMLKALIP